MEEEDTVEKAVAGLAEKVVAAHEETRVQELVWLNLILVLSNTPN